MTHPPPTIVGSRCIVAFMIAAGCVFSAPVGALVADRETSALGAPADADDPAIWIHPTDRSRSLVITAVKEGGGRVYDLGAATVQVLAPFTATSGPASRFNNVDVQYGFRLHDGRRIDLAVATDRGRDVLRIWQIDPSNAATPLRYLGADEPGRLFLDRPANSTNPLSAQNTGYGVALYRDVHTDKLYALASQRSQSRIGQFELIAQADGTVTYLPVRDWVFASMTLGTSTVPLAGKQFEGMVVDQQSGMLYAGQEGVGIWRVDLKTGVAEANPFVLTQTYAPTAPLVADVEGLTIYYGANGGGYLLASSQGNNSFAVFERRGANAYLGSFTVAAGSVDGVQESDGADVTNVSLPGYPTGLFITQDGSNAPEGGTNFKYLPWAAIAAEQGLAVDPSGFDPRNPLAPIPEPQSVALMLAGLALLGWRSCRTARRHHDPRFFPAPPVQETRRCL